MQKLLNQEGFKPKHELFNHRNDTYTVLGFILSLTITVDHCNMI